ncbi:hypothetical protein DAPPUDRAFT_266033 [Daphnia pulex]|uniref:Uncharacterized protein n=1 Tax=Daphnia pulex TaxID=6669 RepID=E9HUD7_DAPPU|nr:hypothetical protein DAPPUDRAFT_266033 [Daphnia pulex]|eukprot:EFX64644.1 hypothetical protein DAPPUDRAFT_266033 [Daphnia pulex]
MNRNPAPFIYYSASETMLNAIIGAERSPNQFQDRNSQPDDQKGAVSSGRAVARLGPPPREPLPTTRIVGNKSQQTTTTRSGRHVSTPDDQLPPGALCAHLQGILPIASRFLNAEQFAQALNPRRYADIRCPPVQAPQPVSPPVQAPLPDIIEEPQPRPAPIQAPLPDIIKQPRAAQEQGAAAAAPIEQAARAVETEEKSEEDDELQLCYFSSYEGSAEDTSSTDENRRGFERELDRNPAFRAAYARNEEARRQRGRFNVRPGHNWSRVNTRGRETRQQHN